MTGVDLMRALTRGTGSTPNGGGGREGKGGGDLGSRLRAGTTVGATDGRRGSVIGSEIPRGVSEWHVGEGAALNNE